jgi:hypothetical protein
LADRGLRAFNRREREEEPQSPRRRAAERRRRKERAQRKERAAENAKKSGQQYSFAFSAALLCDLCGQRLFADFGWEVKV